MSDASCCHRGAVHSPDGGRAVAAQFPVIDASKSGADDADRRSARSSTTQELQRPVPDRFSAWRRGCGPGPLPHSGHRRSRAHDPRDGSSAGRGSRRSTVATPTGDAYLGDRAARSSARPDAGGAERRRSPDAANANTPRLKSPTPSPRWAATKSALISRISRAAAERRRRLSKTT